MKEAKEKTQVTTAVCKQAQLMRRGGASQLQVAELLGISPSTVSRIEAAGFDFETYTRNRIERKAKEEKRKAEQTEVELVQQLEGQMEMDLKQAEKPVDLSDQTKMIRFLAGRFDLLEKTEAANAERIILALDKLNDTLMQIIRCIRRE